MSAHVCPWWLAYSFDNPLRRLVHDPPKLLGPFVGPGMTVLDAGCGMGFFTLGMARLVGEGGTVLAVDVQQKMLDITAKRAARAGLAGRIRLRLCSPGDLGLAEPLDFALAFWMVHEVPDREAFFRQIVAKLKPGGRVLAAEPRLHVSEAGFREMVRAAEAAGLRPAGPLPVRLSRAMVFETK